MLNVRIEFLRTDVRATLQALAERLLQLRPGERAKIFDLYGVLQPFAKAPPDLAVDNITYLVIDACNEFAKGFLQSSITEKENDHEKSFRIYQ